MKRNKLLVLSLLACTLLASCDDENLLINGSNPVGNVDAVNKDNGSVQLDTTLNLQKLYDSLKEGEGGSKAVEVLLDKIAELENVTTYTPENVSHILREIEGENSILTAKQQYKKSLKHQLDNIERKEEDKTGSRFNPEPVKEKNN